MKSDYAEMVRITEADQGFARQRIEELEADNAGKDVKIAQYVEKIQTYHAEITTLSDRVEELQNAEPPTTPDIEAMPIVINLRGQVAALTQAFDLSQKEVTLQKQISAELWGKVSNLEKIADEWRGMYDREHALRVNCELLFKEADRRVSVYRFRGKVATAVAVAGAVVIGAKLIAGK
jgi:hypothetical protein